MEFQMRPISPVALLIALSASAATVDLPRYPAASPDGSQVVFSWRGDLWRAPATGGEAVRLTTNPGDDLRAAFTPDGSSLVFESTREGTRNLWSMSTNGGEPRQLTFGDSAFVLGGVSKRSDGTVWVMGDSSREGDLYRAPRPYMVPLTGGPLARVHDAFGSRPTADAQGRVLFERGGNSWLRRNYRGPDARDAWLFTPGVPAEQAFRRLTSWPGNDGQAQWLAGSDDYLYLSDRDGAVNLYRKSLTDPVDAAGRRLTEFPDDVTGYDVSADGRTAFLTQGSQLWRLDLSKPDARPEAITVTAVADEPDPVEMRKVDKDVTEALASPDGKSMAFVAYGDVFVRSLDEKAPAVRVTSPPSREREIAWSPDGTRLYFVSDATGNDDVMEAVVSRTRSEIRKEANPPKKEEKPKEDRKDEPKPEEATKAAEPAGGSPTTEGKPAADAAKSDVPADDASRKDEPKPEATKPEEKEEPAKPKDPRLDAARWTEAVAFDVRPVVATPASERDPQSSPDGKTLSFRRGGDLVLLDLEKGSERVFRPGWDMDIEWRWSPDSRWIAFAQDDRDFNRDVWLAPADGSATPVNLTRHPDNDRAPRFSADGKLLAFVSGRVNNEFDIYTLALDPSVEALTKAELETYFKDAGEAAKKRKPLPGPNAKKPRAKDAKTADKDGAKADGDAKDGKDAKEEGEGKDSKATPAEYRLDDAYLRVRRITRLPGDEMGLEITPAGDRVVFSGSDGGAPAVLSVKWDGSDQKKVASGGRVSQMNLAGDKVTIVNAGRVSTASPAGGGEAKSVDFGATTPIDRRAWALHRFDEAARTFSESFYDPTMKGLDWPALVRKYRAMAACARTDNEFEWCMARLMGELNASHTGVSVRGPEDDSTRRPAGRLGIRTRPVEGGFEILATLPEGPAVKSQTPLKVGDVITAIASQPLGPTDALEARMRGRVGEETVVTVRRTGDDGQPRSVDCLITPCAGMEEADLNYKAATAKAAQLVNEWSGGRLGYIHIQAMSQQSLDDFERDLCAAASGKDGLLVDVRNNGGGSTADRVLASLMAQPHAYTVPRGADSGYTRGYPQDRLFIQRWTLPTNMLCNEKSFSNAEIVSHAFKNLKRGTLVGEQTYGGVISTGGTSLVDGTTVRLPFRGWYTPEGRDMENNGALPDIRVPPNPVDEANDLDAQLKAAVDDLLGRLPAGNPPAANASKAGDQSARPG
jgi:tricorn protease